MGNATKMNVSGMPSHHCLLPILQPIFINRKVSHSTVQSETSYRKLGLYILWWIGILVSTTEAKAISLTASHSILWATGCFFSWFCTGSNNLVFTGTIRVYWCRLLCGYFARSHWTHGILLSSTVYENSTNPTLTLSKRMARTQILCCTRHVRESCRCLVNKGSNCLYVIASIHCWEIQLVIRRMKTHSFIVTFKSLEHVP